MPRRLVTIVLWLALVAASASAEVVRVEIASHRDLAGGRAFGPAGAYEKVAGTLHFALDPANPANRIIADIALAPRNALGRVEFSADFYLVRPKDPRRGNGTLLFEVSNRGGKGLLPFFNRASASLDPSTNEEVGDGFLMARGFTLLWVGWQFDPPQREPLLHLKPPIATDRGRPIQGLVRSEVIVASRTFDASLADRDHVPYVPVDPASAANTLTVRDTVEGPRRTIPRAEWSFGRREGDRMVPDNGRVYLAAGFEPGRIYEVVYRAANPPVAGTGPAAVRDAISFMKHAAPDTLGLAPGGLVRAIGFGVSQSGRFLRTFLHDGFNEDESHRKVFDGVMAHVAGGGRGSFNIRFAQPSRDGHPFLNRFYPTDIFPFTDLPETDPATGATAGLLAHVKPEHLPKIFYTNSSYEYWGRAASLIHTTADGRADAPLPPTTRIYTFAGGQHGPAAFPPPVNIGQQRSNPNDYRWLMRSLLVSMDRWIRDGVDPPPSRYPRVADDTLVTIDRWRFPELPNVRKPAEPMKAYRVDYGPRFAKEGIITKEPPLVGEAFTMRIPQVDADGNETAGLRMPEVAVPLATYTGWNLFNAASGPEQLLSSMQGSYIPFARTRAERASTNDPRASIEERYASRDAYLAAVQKAAGELVHGGYLLEEDVTPILARAAEHWDALGR